MKSLCDEAMRDDFFAFFTNKKTSTKKCIFQTQFLDMWRVLYTHVCSISCRMTRKHPFYVIYAGYNKLKKNEIYIHTALSKRNIKTISWIE